MVIYQVGAPAAALPAVIPSDSNWTIAGLNWAKNDRLIIVVKQPLKKQFDNRLRTWVRATVVKADGTDLKPLLKDQVTYEYNLDTARIVDVNLDDPDTILMQLFNLNRNVDEESRGGVGGDEDNARLDLMKVNLATGKSNTEQTGSPNTVAWFTDGHGHALGRLDRSHHPDVDHLKLLSAEGWRAAGDFDSSEGDSAGIAGLTEDGKALAKSRRGASGHLIMVRHELANGDDKAILFSNDKYDLDDPILDEWTRRVVGASYMDDRPEYSYFDPARDMLQKSLEKAFPGLTVRAASTNLARDRVIVEADGPHKPPTYYLLDRNTHQATQILSAYPNLTEADLGEMKPYPYKARDGLDIPAYLTLPPGKLPKNLPVVVMPHGGPDSRDSIGFDWWAQFLANRGYAVLQPNYRGSYGYGEKFTEAGLLQWGLKMQDDITDGVKKMIADGIADPKRICIVGASYGGYAALAGATFTPGLYACAMSYAGVSDLPEMLSNERGDWGKDSQALSFWFSRVGSSYDNGEQIRATSPARHADQVTCPILLVHGEGDTTVRIKQSELMYDALKAAGKDVQFVRVPNDDHYLTFGDTRIRMLNELEKFLAAHIGT